MVLPGRGVFVHRCLPTLCKRVSEAYLILENVARKETATILQKEVNEIGYISVCVLANSFTFGVPQSRTRLYLLAVCPLRVDVIHGPEKWVSWLQDREVAPSYDLRFEFESESSFELNLTVTDFTFDSVICQ